MLFEVFSSLEQVEFPAFLGVLDLVIHSLLIVYKTLSSVEFEYSVRVGDKYVEIWECWVLSCW